MRNWIETDIAVDNALKVDIKQYLIDTPQNEGTQMYVKDAVGVWQFEASKVFNQDWIDTTSARLGIEINSTLIFARKAKYQHAGAHIDVNPINDILNPVSHSFNWVLDADNNPMVWYKPWWDPEDIKQGKLAVQGKIPFPGHKAESQSSGSMVYQETPCDLLERDSEHCISHKTLTVCRTNIPHNVDMVSDKDRWCITARHIGDKQPIWSEVVSRFT